MNIINPFNIIIYDIPDLNPNNNVIIPTRKIQNILIELNIGKIKPIGGMKLNSRYSQGNPCQYFMSVIVYFQNTINYEFRKNIENNHIYKVLYSSDNEINKKFVYIHNYSI